MVKNDIKVYLVNYSDSNFESIRNSINIRVSSFFDGIFSYNRNNLENSILYRECKFILDQKRGAGYWLWKPYFILKSLSNLKDGDVLFYSDCGDFFDIETINYIKNYFSYKESDFLISSFFGKNHNNLLQKNLTKRDCFILMGCDFPEYHNEFQAEAGALALRKSKNSIEFVEEWLNYSKNINIITDEPNITLDNFDGFVDHRHDQSILTNLMVKYKIKGNSDLCKLIKFNYF